MQPGIYESRSLRMGLATRYKERNDTTIYDSRNLRMGLADGLCVVCVGIYESRNLRMGLAKNRLVDACHLSTKVEI